MNHMAVKVGLGKSDAVLTTYQLDLVLFILLGSRKLKQNIGAKFPNSDQLELIHSAERK